jgi:tRNA threonylcarbamoyladenosine modification (KEOPS) complex  Pcc1 subunit
MKQITITIDFDTNNQASIIASALRPEIVTTIPHTKATITTKDSILILNIEAKQTSTLRAACNSYLRWIQTALSVHNIV